VVGSSLMLYSGYRFVHAAAQAGKPVVAVNLGRTRADELLTLKVSEPCVEALAALQIPAPLWERPSSGMTRHSRRCPRSIRGGHPA